MTKMPATLRAVHFCSGNTNFKVGLRANAARQRLVKAWPTRAAFKFCGRGKQPLVTASTDIDAVPFFAVQRAAIGSLSILLAQYTISRWRQAFFPFGIAIGDGKACLSRRILTTAQDEHSRAGTTDRQELALAQLQDMFL